MLRISDTTATRGYRTVTEKVHDEAGYGGCCIAVPPVVLCGVRLVGNGSNYKVPYAIECLISCFCYSVSLHVDGEDLTLA